MTVLLIVGILVASVLVYSLAWEGARLMWWRRSLPIAMRLPGAIVGFYVFGLLSPVLALAFFVRYRTCWPVSRGRLGVAAT
jgi:hypothetical protein